MTERERRTPQAISLLQKLGDSMRSGDYPSRSCSNWTALESMNLGLQDLSEIRQTLQSRLSRHITALRNTRGDHHMLELLKKAVPEFCRLHSVVHGLEVWFHHHRDWQGPPYRAHIGFCTMASAHSIKFLNEELKVSSSTYREMLILAGRHIVDPNYECFHLAPPPSPSNPTPPDCLIH